MHYHYVIISDHGFRVPMRFSSSVINTLKLTDTLSPHSFTCNHTHSQANQQNAQTTHHTQIFTHLNNICTDYGVEIWTKAFVYVKVNRSDFWTEPQNLWKSTVTTKQTTYTESTTPVEFKHIMDIFLKVYSSRMYNAHIA